MNSDSSENYLRRIRELENRLEEAEQLVEAIRTGEVDAFALTKNDRSEVFTLQSGDYAYRVLVENFSEGALNLSEDGLIVYTNIAFHDMLGLSYENVIGQPIYNFIAPASVNNFKYLFSKGLAGQVKGEINLVRGDKVVPVLVSLTSLYPMLHTVGMIVTDLSERRDHEEVLTRHTELLVAKKQIEEREKHLELLSNSVPSLIFYIDKNMRYVSCNDAFMKWFAVGKDEVIGKTVIEFVGEAGWDIARPHLEKAFNGLTEEFQAWIPYQHGEPRWVQAVFTPHKNDRDEILGVIALVSDITEQKEFAQTLEKKIEERTSELIYQKNFINSVLESTNHGVLSYRAIRENGKITDFLILYANVIALTQLNLPAEKVIGNTYLNVVPKAKELGLWQRLVRIATSGISETHEIQSIVFPERTFLARFTPLDDGVTVTFIDISEQKEHALELEDKNRELQLMNKELESFTYVSSHDLQEPLRKIQTFTSRLIKLEYKNLSDTAKDYLNRMQNSAVRMQNLIQDLLHFSRINSAERKFEKVNMEKIINDIKTDYRDVLEEKKVILEAEGTGDVMIIPFQFRQLMQNLVSNAVKFSKPGVLPHIKIKTEKVKNLPFGLKRPQNGSYHHISVSDNGIGIESQYNEKIFQVFQKLHNREQYPGTGIGLAIVKKIVENHNGYISVSGTPGEGTTFDIYIPAQ